MTILPKLIVIVGPTASGKTELAISLAKKFCGEVVSADSRQIYSKMNIGTAKPAGEWRVLEGRNAYEVDGIPHYCMDMVDPAESLTAPEFKLLALEHIYDIAKRGKIPLLVGGTGLYVWSVVDNLEFPKIPPDRKIRLELEKKPLVELQVLLEKYDPLTFQSIDARNPRRLLRALEVVIASGQSFMEQRKYGMPLFTTLQIGIQWEREALNARIKARVESQFEQGLVEEVKRLLDEGYSWQLPSMSSLGYPELGAYWRGESTLFEARRAIEAATRRYAKRQMTWFKRDQRIRWIHGAELAEAEEQGRDFLAG